MNINNSPWIRYISGHPIPEQKNGQGLSAPKYESKITIYVTVCT